MDFSTVDIEEVGFDRPCTKEVHGSLGSLDIHLVMFTGIAHTEWPAKGAITPLHGALTTYLKDHKKDLPPATATACDLPSLTPDTMDVLVFHKWGKQEPTFFKGIVESDAPKLVQYLQDLENAGEDALESGEEFVAPKSPFELRETHFEIFVLTCAHVKRDMRCGYCGSKLHDLIEEEIKRRGKQEKILALRVAHVGGHAFAGNVLVYPSGIWYGYMRPADVPKLFDEHIENGKILFDHLRGKIGLSKTENAEFANNKGSQ